MDILDNGFYAAYKCHIKKLGGNARVILEKCRVDHLGGADGIAHLRIVLSERDCDMNSAVLTHRLLRSKDSPGRDIKEAAQYLEQEHPGLDPVREYLELLASGVPSRFNKTHLEQFPELRDYIRCLYAFEAPSFRHSRREPSMTQEILEDFESCSRNFEFFEDLAVFAGTEERSIRFLRMSRLMSAHMREACDCRRKTKCPAAKYLSGAWDIGYFFESSATPGQ